MPAALYWPVRAIFIRAGPDCHQWGDPYVISLDCELLGDLGVIGGLDREISREMWRDVVRRVAEAGYRPAEKRAKTGLENIRLLPIPKR